MTTSLPLFASGSFSQGKYLVSPLVRPHAHGGFTASVSIRSGRGTGTHDRVFRFAPRFDTNEGASRFAAEQGRLWLLQRAAA
jgi:hypothetical protein